MSYSIEKLPDEPVILTRWHEGFDPKTEMAGLSKERAALLAAQTEPTFLITDVRASRPDLEEIMVVANAARADTPPNLREHIIVTDNLAIKMATKGLDTDAFKHRKMPVFSDLDEAMTYVHQQLRSI